jgi:ectoine hydroxylase-related dioxygenase (phytanoyl-CoA dioxygenase family)
VEHALQASVEFDTAYWTTTPPGAPDQDFHRDVGHSGAVSVLVPLMDFHSDFGPLAFCPTTHHPPASRWEFEVCPHLIPLPAAGDAVLYDPALIHRGCANNRTQTRHALYSSIRINKQARVELVLLISAVSVLRGGVLKRRSITRVLLAVTRVCTCQSDLHTVACGIAPSPIGYCSFSIHFTLMTSRTHTTSIGC